MEGSAGVYGGNVVAACMVASAGGLFTSSQPLGVSAAVRNGAGDYSITHNDIDKLNGVRLVTVLGKVYAQIDAATMTDTLTKVLTFTDAGAAADTDFYFCIIRTTPGY